MMRFINEFLHLIGLDVDLSYSSSGFLLMTCAILLLSTIAYISFINIVIYFISLYIIEHKFFLDKVSKYPRILKLLGWYRKIRISFIIYCGAVCRRQEKHIILFLVSLGGVIWTCYKVIIILSTSSAVG